MFFELNNKLLRQIIGSIIPTKCDFTWTFGQSNLMLSGRNSNFAVWVTLNKVLFERYIFNTLVQRSVCLHNLLAVLKHLDANSTVLVDLNSAQKFTLSSNNKNLHNEFIFPTVDPPESELPSPGLNTIHTILVLFLYLIILILID